MLFESEKLDEWYRKLNSEECEAPRGYRRDVVVYELVCYVNNIIGCYLGRNIKPILRFIERSRLYMERVPPKENLEKYYTMVDNYLTDLEHHLKSNGVNLDR